MPSQADFALASDSVRISTTCPLDQLDAFQPPQSISTRNLVNLNTISFFEKAVHRKKKMCY